MAFYFDTSAAAKLVLDEIESDGLEAWMIASDSRYVTSDLTRTELMRATRRFAPDRMIEARQVLEVFDLLTVSTAVCERAGLIDPVLMRSLDAIHLASALELGDDLDGIVTYDDRLAEAATAHGILAIAPQPT